MKLDHICFAVKNLPAAIDYWTHTFGFTQKTRIVENSRQKVKVVFLNGDNNMTIKLIEPFANNLSLINFVNHGGNFHHLCFKCSDLDEKIDELTKKGLIMLVRPQPGEAFNNHNIAFMLTRQGINIELIDTDEKAELLSENSSHV